MNDRCGWASDELMARYHDEEWGRPVFDSQELFECLNLEGAQAGLSWRSVLIRREGYREAFAGFDPEAAAGLSDAELEHILATGAIIRNRAKVFGVRQNARAWLALPDPVGFLWSFVGGHPLDPARQTLADVPATSDESIAMSRSLKKAGFTFCGPTICYAFMQAVGMVNDHVVTCPCYEVSKSCSSSLSRLRP